MGELQAITYNGQVAAVVVGDEAIISAALSAGDERTVKAMCLYALDVSDGREPGPYTDEQAIQYARRAERETRA